MTAGPLKADLQSFGIRYKEQPDATDFIVIDESRWLSHLEDTGKSFFAVLGERIDAERIVLIYNQDDANLVTFPTNIKCFVTHMVEGFDKNPFAFPVPFGFTFEGFQEAEKIYARGSRKNQVIQNFNPTFNQSVRESIIAAVDSMQLGGLNFDERKLHGAEYSDQLSEAAFCLAVGGSYYWPRSDYSYLAERMDVESRVRDSFPNRKRRVGILRWDSFRFWESMAFGCVPIQLNFDIYGFRLPTRPVAWQHYIPLDLCDIKASFERMSELMNSPSELNQMSESCKTWARAHIHPTVLYQYVLDQAGFN